jgi:hypothetical protein
VKLRIWAVPVKQNMWLAIRVSGPEFNCVKACRTCQQASLA